MPPIARKVLTAAALTALTAVAGCGSKPEPARPKPPVPPAKSEAPAPPEPPKPAEIAWGKAVDGLQAGIVFIGGYQERDLRMTAAVTRLLAKYTGPEHRMSLRQALEAAIKDTEGRYVQGTFKALHEEVVGGSTLSAALLKYGLAGGRELIESTEAGETAGELPAVLASLTGSFEKRSRARSSFVETEHFSVEVRLRNVGDKSISLPDHPAWLASLTLTGEGTVPDVVCGPAPLNGYVPKPTTLAPGAEIDFTVWSGLPKVFRDKPGGAKYVACPNGLPPGRYSLTFACTHLERAAEACPHWHGRAESAAIMIEVRPDPTPVAWGPVTGDLQVGLLLRGSAAQGDWKQPGLCPDCKPRRPGDPPGACRNGGVGCRGTTESAYYRFCEPCAALKRICQNCGAARPAGGVFFEGQPIEFEARFRNFGDSDVVLGDAGHISQWRFEFVPKGGGQTLIGQYDTRYKECRKGRPVTVPKRSTAAFVVKTDWRCIFGTAAEGSRLMGGSKGFQFLPAGKYVMTATCAYDPPRELTTGPVEIEIKPKAAPAVSEARAREIALAAVAEHGWKVETNVDKIELVEGRLWRVLVTEAMPKPAMSYAEVEIDAETGKVTAYKVIPGE